MTWSGGGRIFLPAIELNSPKGGFSDPRSQKVAGTELSVPYFFLPTLTKYR